MTAMTAGVVRAAPGTQRRERAGPDGVARLLADRPLRYCVLHGWEAPPNRPRTPRTDVDIAIDPGDLGRLEATLWTQSGGPPAQLVQVLQHESCCYYFVVAVRGRTGPEFVVIDAVPDFRRDGYVFFTTEQLLAGRRQADGLWVAAPATELAYLLVKKVSKGRLPEHQKARLEALSRSLGPDARAVACRTFGAAWGPRVLEWLARPDWAAFEARLPRLRRALRAEVLRRDPLNPVRYWGPELQRRWRRWRHPTGLSVAVLGPDGAGKSTFIANLSAQVADAFRRTAAFHLYPVLNGHAETRVATDPHGRPPHPFWRSLFKLFYFASRCGFGYLAVVRPRLTRSTLVLFDRCYDDLLVDPRRYRYGGPMALPRLVRHLIPAPDLRFVLDVPEAQLLQRKREVAPEEIRRQCTAYRRLAADLGGAVLLDGSLPAAEVARHGTDIILDHLHRRCAERRGGARPRCDRAALDWLAGTLYPPGASPTVAVSPAPGGAPEPRDPTHRLFAWWSLNDGRGYLLPAESERSSVRALELYNPQSRRARLGRSALAAALRLGAGRRVLPRVQFRAPRPFAPGTGAGGRGSFFEYLQTVLGRDDLQFAVSLGKPGPHRKPVLLVCTGEGDALAYVKLGANEATNALVEHEANVLDRLARAAFRSFGTPRVLHAGRWHGRYVCVQSAPPARTAPPSTALDAPYVAAARELAAWQTRWLTLGESALARRLPQRSETIVNRWHRHLLERGLRKAEDWAGRASLPFHFSHGDLVPWNAKREGERLWFFDWEYAADAGPPGRDVIHFLFQTMRFLQKRDPAAIFDALLSERPGREGVASSLRRLDLAGVPPELCLLLYCLERLSQGAAAAPDDPLMQQEMRAFALWLHGL